MIVETEIKEDMSLADMVRKYKKMKRPYVLFVEERSDGKTSNNHRESPPEIEPEPIYVSYTALLLTVDEHPSQQMRPFYTT